MTSPTAPTWLAKAWLFPLATVRLENYYEISLNHGFDWLRMGRCRFNNLTPPAPRMTVGGDYRMDIEGREEEEGVEEHVDLGDECSIGDE